MKRRHSTEIHRICIQHRSILLIQNYHQVSSNHIELFHLAYLDQFHYGLVSHYQNTNDFVSLYHPQMPVRSGSCFSMLGPQHQRPVSFIERLLPHFDSYLPDRTIFL